ncbi:MAG: hypothetical protein M1837_003902 [Sclerophora amabilis]|nr:MAG: hypothetical protein M1837_003902 [Sclerophora amabilis]
MPSTKERLYIGLYARSVPNTYHWAFLVTPKNETGAPNETVRYHVANRPALRDGSVKDTWSFERRELESLQMHLLLVRVLIGKISEPFEAFDASVGRVPVVQDDQSWRCRTWTRKTLAQLAKDGILSSAVVDWETVEKECVGYVERKKAQDRFRITPLPEQIPTYDLIHKKELIP